MDINFLLKRLDYYKKILNGKSTPQSKKVSLEMIKIYENQLNNYNWLDF